MEAVHRPDATSAPARGGRMPIGHGTRPPSSRHAHAALSPSPSPNPSGDRVLYIGSSAGASAPAPRAPGQTRSRVEAARDCARRAGHTRRRKSRLGPPNGLDRTDATRRQPGASKRLTPGQCAARRLDLRPRLAIGPFAAGSREASRMSSAGPPAARARGARLATEVWHGAGRLAVPGHGHQRGVGEARAGWRSSCDLIP
jgi:hypothetical protein